MNIEEIDKLISTMKLHDTVKFLSEKMMYYERIIYEYETRIHKLEVQNSINKINKLNSSCTHYWIYNSYGNSTGGTTRTCDICGKVENI